LELLVRGDVAAVLELRGEEPLGEVALRALAVVASGDEEQAMSVAGARRGGVRPVEGEAFGRRDRAGLAHHAPGAGAVAPCQTLTERLARHRGLHVELEREEQDLEAVAVRPGIEGAEEPALADRAPRAGDVGPDLDSHAVLTHGFSSG